MGPNLDYSPRRGTAERVRKLLQFPPGTLKLARSGKLCTTDDAIANNLAAYEPRSIYDIALTSDDRVFICTGKVSATSFTWTQIA